jgi:hypothetical protein
MRLLSDHPFKDCTCDIVRGCKIRVEMRAYHKIVHYMEEDKPTEARKLA